MARLIGFFLLVFMSMLVLRELPVIGSIFRIPFLGFYLTAILLSAGLSKLAAYALDRSKQRALERQLGAVDTPHNMGKLGSLILSQGRAKDALPHLQKAVDGDPDSVEWRFRLGQAKLKLGDLAGARQLFESAAADDEEYGYGKVLLQLAEVLTRQGEHRQAFEALERFERNHGPSPESAFRRGLALRAGGHGDEAKRAFQEVRELAEQLAKFGRKDQGRWVWRSYFAR